MGQSSNIPAELAGRSQWVNHLLFKTQAGKLTKLPVDPATGRYASVSDPATWSSLDRALLRLDTDPRLKGIGFVFSEADPLTGIDFDHCRDAVSGKISPVVLEWILRLNSYSEISISGTGVHVIVNARLSAAGCRRNGIEMYDRRRFFVFTGQHLDGTPLTVEPRQAEVDALHAWLFPPQPVRQAQRKMVTNLTDSELLRRIERSRQGEKFQRLMRGDWSGYTSQSEADLALCAVLAFWTQDDGQIDRIFRSSVLYRGKWDESHHRDGLTYGEMTIAKALELP